MIATSWLPTINQALRRVGLAPVADATELSNNATDSAQTVNLYFDQAMEYVLRDHEWRIAKKRVFLGSATTQLAPVLPVGLAEATSADQHRENIVPIPAPDTSGTPAAGTVPFEIQKILSVDGFPRTEWWVRERYLVFRSPVAGINLYATAYVKPSAAMAAFDVNFDLAFRLALALMCAPPSAGKDSTRDAILKNELTQALINGRFDDLHQSNPDNAGDGWWLENARGGSGLPEVEG